MKRIKLNLFFVICISSFMILTFLSLYLTINPAIIRLRNYFIDKEYQNVHEFIDEVFVSDIEKQAVYLNQMFINAMDFAKHLSKDSNRILNSKNETNIDDLEFSYDNDSNIYYYINRKALVKLDNFLWGFTCIWDNKNKLKSMPENVKHKLNRFSAMESVMEAICLNPNGIVSVFLKMADCYIGYSRNITKIDKLSNKTKNFYLGLYGISNDKQKGIWSNAHPSCFGNDIVISYILSSFNKKHNINFDVNVGLSYHILEKRLDNLLTKSDYNEYNVIRLIINGNGEIMCFPEKFYSVFSIKEAETDSFIKNGKKIFTLKNRIIQELLKEIAVKDNGMFERVINGKNYLISFRQMPVNDWNIIVLAESDKLYKGIENTKAEYSKIFKNKDTKVFIYFLTIFILALIIPIIFIRKIIVNPIKNLRKNFNKLGKGNFSLRINNRSKINEVYELTQDFNKLGAQLQNYTSKLKTEERKREAIKVEMNVAWELQKSALPKITRSFIREEFELFANLVPAKEMSGDFYDFFYLNEETLVVVLADVSGKGLPAAFYMSMAKVVIKETCLKFKEKSPGEILYLVNEKLSYDNERCMFLTAYLVFYNIKTGKLVYSNAGHHEYLTIDSNGYCEADGIARSTALGIFSDSEYITKELTLKNNQIFALYTDGITEAASSKFEEFGTERVLSFFQENYKKDLNELGEFLIEKVIDFQEGKKHDDVTLVILKCII